MYPLCRPPCYQDAPREEIQALGLVGHVTRRCDEFTFLDETLPNFILALFKIKSLYRTVVLNGPLCSTVLERATITSTLVRYST